MYLVDGADRDELPADDRGLQFGDGLFETIAVVDGRPVLLDKHLERLGRGTTALGLPAPDTDRLAAEAQQLAETAGRGILKVLYTAGSGGRGYARPEPVQPRRILSLHADPRHANDRWNSGIRVAVSRVRLARQPALAGIKHLNRLEQVLARRQVEQAAVAEGLMRDQNGHFIEGTMSNLFLVIDGEVRTPFLEACGVAGIMRDAIMTHLTDQGFQVGEELVDDADLGRASEVFLCNSINGVWPVTHVDDVAVGSIGPVSRRLQQWIDRERLACTPATRDGEAAR
ncbi:aminodeoxychorismate lyase [Aquisalimonas lutea]|uniref:aminodeoxychorismate lyase n=1 Tax=Aquisalimonas lutea TaxID=1327750 RepID=UPI0025B30999|nr:aminodeoxychorismate lyase [Aquisalimonas lutea]MDN3518476.1 aminodeoxychorismate lyase [Aquisalimonas lutea]